MQQPRRSNLQQAPDGTYFDVDAQGFGVHPQAQLFQQHQRQAHAQAQVQAEAQAQVQQYAPSLPPHALHFDPHGLPPQFPPHAYQHVQQLQHIQPAHQLAHATGPPFVLAGPAHQIHTPLAHTPILTPIHTTPRIAQRPLQIAQQPSQQPSQQPIQQSPQLQQYSSPLDSQAGEDVATLASHGQFKGLRLIPNPPDLDEWRQRLFDVDDTITLTEDQFQTYFPHIDNVYSHRSTQRHKRKSFVSHYWDCRLKGRPPGTKKSTDPDKKKRKRVARERDLCDVKIKITEFFDRREYEEQMGHPPPTIEDNDPLSITSNQTGMAGPSTDPGMFFAQPHPEVQQNMWGMQQNIAQPSMNLFAPPPPPLPGPLPKKFYTFQRVNGNGGNGKGDGVAGPHKHTLEESDRVKKNIVIRTLVKSEKDIRKVQVSPSSYTFLRTFQLEQEHLFHAP